MKKRMSLQDKAMLALKQAVKEVVEHHRETGRPLAIWENGKVKWVVPQKRLSRKSRP